LPNVTLGEVMNGKKLGKCNMQAEAGAHSINSVLILNCTTHQWNGTQYIFL